MRSSTENIPQPWEWDGEHRTREEFMADALISEAEGSCLVAENVVGYEDPMDEPGSWIVDDFIYTEYRTNAYVWHFDPNEIEDPSEQMAGLIVVERRQAEV